MNSTVTEGQAMHDPDAEARRQAASAMGKARTERKVQASRANAALATEARRGKPLSEETKALLSEKQQARRERERQERETAAAAAGPVEKKQAGRPRTRPLVEASEKRGRGRPKKQDAPTTAEAAGEAERGTGEAKTA